MWQIILSMAVLTVFAGPARASDPTADWRVEEGQAHIRTALCEGRLWGIVSWERKPGIDRKNPDPSLRNRPTLGLPIVLGMNPVRPNRWEGAIYNAENGKTYRASVTLKGPNELEVEGCVWGGWVCSSETWTRVRPDPASVGSAPGSDLCLRLGVAARPSHKSGLK